MGCGGTRLKIHHKRSALLRQSERSGPNVEQWLTDLHLLGHYRTLHSGAALNHLQDRKCRPELIGMISKYINRKCCLFV